MKFTERCSIITGIAGRDDVALVTVMNDGLAEERQQHAIPLLYRQGRWRLAGEEKVLPWLVAGVASMFHSSLEFVIVGWGGQVLVVENQNSHREAIQRKDDYVSIVRSVATINNAVYAVGMRRQVHKRHERNRWIMIDHGVASPGDEFAIGFNAIDGFDDDEIYAVGLNGEMWRRDKASWHQVHSPTNAHLHSICCSPGGRVYVGGKSGVFIRGRRDAWEFLDLETDETIWDLHWFEGELYAILGNGIYVVENERVRRVENEEVSDGDFHSLSSSEGKLWVFGRKKIIQTEGSSWKEVDCFLPDTFDDSGVLGFFNDDVLSSGSDYLDDVE